MSPQVSHDFCRVENGFCKNHFVYIGGQAVARRTDPETSHAAAKTVNVPKGQQAILSTMRRIGPATDEQIYDSLPALPYSISLSGARTRRSELVRKGLARDTGRRTRTRANRLTIIWEAV